MSDGGGGYGLGSAAQDIITGTFGVLAGQQQAEIAQTQAGNIERQLASTQKTQTYLIYGAFGLLFFGAFMAIQSNFK